MNAKERVAALFKGEETDRPACFSGMGNVTTAGLDELGYRFAEVHLDARQMAKAAASTPKLFGFDCAVVPFDLTVEAEAMGALINTYAHSDDLLYPTIKEKVINDVADEIDLDIPADVGERGRVPLVCEAIGLAKSELGGEVPVGSYVLGPFTLAGQIMELNDLLKLSFKKTEMIGELLGELAGVVIAVGRKYREAGADYLTVREMGATSDVLNPRLFDKLILPHLKRIFAELQGPNVIHICGKTNKIVGYMSESGAEAISVDQRNDLAQTREDLGPDALVFGNYDPFNVLVDGTPELVEETIRGCLDNGADAVWPGCDIWPTVPPENFTAMMDTVKSYER